MTENRSRPAGLVIPTLYYDDVARAIDWLAGAFGFEERFRYGDERVQGASLRAGAGAVMLSAARTGQAPDSNDAAELRPPRQGDVHVNISVHVGAVDEHYARTKRFGARIVLAPLTYPFGERQYTVEDLAGYRWTFSQSVADVAPEEWGATPGPGA